jgi:hypothetical protein
MTDDLSIDPDYLDEKNKENIEDYICCICQFLQNPETAIEEENCGHIFCQICIDNWLKKNNLCPFCKGKIIKRNIKNKNKMIYRQIINFIVLCSEKNCNWKGTIKEYENHLKNQHNIKQISNDNFELFKYYKATCHIHPLKYFDTSIDNGWSCDCCKCFSGITNFEQTKKMKRFRCVECDFDLCLLCMNNYYDRNYIIANDSSTASKKNYLLNMKYHSSVHKHPLIFLDKTRDNGWGCDGRNLGKKCFSGITGFHQSFNIPRFRCEQCDFDLCENCMNNYNYDKYELNKFYQTNIHQHKLIFLGKTRDNGWGCDGRKFKDGCLSGITGFWQTIGFDRFRCEACDFDLCRSCMEHYSFQ